jgi:hypothetical protein
MGSELRSDLPAGASARIWAEDHDPEQRQMRRRGALTYVRSSLLVDPTRCRLLDRATRSPVRS